MFERARNNKWIAAATAATRSEHSALTRRGLLRSAGAASLAVSAYGVLGSRVGVRAQEATPEPHEMGLPPGCTVIAENLINPRFITIDDDGNVYVSESGIGGDEPLAFSLEEPGAEESPEAEEPAGSRGFTGQVTKIATDGSVTVVAQGLPSYAFGPETTGPAGIVLADGKIWLAVGGAGPATAMLEALPNENSVVAIDPETGAVTLVADVGAYERVNNPHGAAVDANLYDLALAADGLLYVADAGGNTVYHVDPASGELALLAVLEDIPLPEGAQGPPMLEAVPTGVAANPAGGIYVGLLTGGPFPPGAAKVLAVGPDGTVADAATGLTMVVDVAVGPDGNLYASQISTNFLAVPPAAGNVVRILADGTQEVVVNGLPLPNGIAFDAAGNLFIVANAASFGPPAGMVLRCDGVAAGTM